LDKEGSSTGARLRTTLHCTDKFSLFMPLHEDAMLSPKRSDFTVYYSPFSLVFPSTQGMDGYGLVYSWSSHRIVTRRCFRVFPSKDPHGNKPRVDLAANCLTPDMFTFSTRARLYQLRGFQSFHRRHACPAGESLIANARSVPLDRVLVLDRWGYL